MQVVWKSTTVAGRGLRGARGSQKMGTLGGRGSVSQLQHRMRRWPGGHLAEITEAGFQPLENSGKSKTRRSGVPSKLPRQRLEPAK